MQLATRKDMNTNLPKLKLGSEGEKALNKDSKWDPNAKRIPMFSVQGLYPGFFSEKNTPHGYQCVILPAFDSSLQPYDTVYQESYMPCRNKKLVTDEGAYAFTGWFCTVYGHTYYGSAKSSFISPVTWDLPDPLAEIYNYVAPKKKSDSRMAKLMDYTANDKKTIISRPTRLRLINIWGPSTVSRSEDQGEKNRVLCLKPMAFDKLVEDLNRTGTTDNKDPNWPNHIFGDPTDPERAILCSPKLYPSPMQSQNGFFGLYLGTTSFTTDAMHLDAQFTKITKEMLRGRYRLNEILYAPEYEEIMDIILSDGLIPRDIVEAACSRVPVERKTYVAPPPAVKEEPVFAPISPAPVTPAPAPTPAPSSILTPEDEARYKELLGIVHSGQGTVEMIAEFRALREKYEQVHGIGGI